MPTSDRFTEQHLLADVCATWGEFGAHADLTRWLIATVQRLDSDNDRVRRDVASTAESLRAQAAHVVDLEREIERLRSALSAARTGAALLRCERLESAGDALHDAVRNHDLTEAHLRAWVEARRNGSADGAETVVQGQGLRCG